MQTATQQAKQPVYQVIDRQTGDVVATYHSRKAATRKADKLDLEYGAIRYRVQS